MREIYEQLQNLDFAHYFVFDISLVRTLDKMPQLGPIKTRVQSKVVGINILINEADFFIKREREGEEREPEGHLFSGLIGG